MIEVTIGEIIREKRKQLHLTQEEACFGICDKVTMSRIETNKQTPTRSMLNALLQRLDISDDRFYAAINAEELRINELCKEITAYNVKYEKATGREKQELKELLKIKQSELRNIMEPGDKLTEQFIVRSEVISGDYNPDEKIIKLTAAIELTHPKFQLAHVKHGIFSIDEIKIINQIAVAFSGMGKSKEALKIWEDLLANNKNRYENIVPARTQRCLILYGLAREYLIVNNYIKALDYAEEGRKLAVDHGIYRHLPGFLIILAECSYHLENVKKSREIFEDAYHLCKVINDSVNERIITDAMKEYFE
ncbi:MAG: helix-turn-helix transcriptional regulator [Butyrivibrio sp.]|nr:helix-turn-helix transcriptional regulator [Butyrivibrio sp.]